MLRSRLYENLHRRGQTENVTTGMGLSNALVGLGIHTDNSCTSLRGDANRLEWYLVGHQMRLLRRWAIDSIPWQDNHTLTDRI